MASLQRVLIIASDERRAARLHGVLETQFTGVETLCVTTGAAGLQAAAEQDFDVALIDDPLPDMGGVELIEKLRQCRREIVHLFVISELADPVFAGDLLQAGTSELIPRSLSLERSLPVLLRRALDRRDLHARFDIDDDEYLRLLEQTSDAVYILAGEGFVFVNARFEQMFGYNRDEIFGADFDYQGLIAPESRDMIRQRAERSARGEMLEPRYEFVATNKNGERFDVSVSVAYIEHQGEPATLGILQDITERKTFEKALVRRNRQLAVLNDIAATVNRSLDLGTVLDIATERLMSVMGLSAAGISLVNRRLGVLESHVFRGVTDVFKRHLRAIPLGSGVMGLAASTGELIVVDDLRNDDRVHINEVRGTGFVSTVAVPIKAQGKVLGVAIGFSERQREFSPEELDLLTHIGNQIGTAVDKAQIHERQKATVRRLVALDELTRLIGGTLDTREVFSLAAIQLRRLVGADRVSVALYDPRHDRFELDFLSVDGAEVESEIRSLSREDSVLSEAIEAQHPVTLDLARARGEYERYVASLGLKTFVAVPILVEHNPVGTLNLSWAEPGAIDNDVIEVLNALAAHLAVAIKNTRLFSQLESTLTELEAAQERLVQTGRLEALGELAAGVAHDFNNVLGAILGRAQLLKRYVHDPALKKNVDVIERAALDGAATVQRIQEFSRKRDESQYRELNLSKLVREAVEYTQPRWRDRPAREGLHIDLVLDCASTPAVLGNAHELREVLTNLIHNACDAMETGGRLLVRSGERDGAAFVEVSDEGSGMAPEVRARIFDPFYSTKGGRGTGLGLSVSYGIITQHGGTIDVDSTPGKGSVFVVVLPAADGSRSSSLPPEVTRAEVEAPASAPSNTASSLTAKSVARILVIDDEEAIREVLADILMTENHEVVLAENGNMGIEKFADGDYDLVFTDLGMPGINGFDVARAIKERRPEQMIGLLTGWGASVDENEMRQAGIDVLVCKPFKYDEVMAVVSQALGH